MTLYERDKEKFQEGLEQGVEKGKIEVAKNLLHRIDDEQIASMTGLAIEVIKQLRNK